MKVNRYKVDKTKEPVSISEQLSGATLTPYAKAVTLFQKRKFKEANTHLLKREIRKARELSDGVVGVNIMVALSDYNNLLECALEEEVDIVFLGAGLPLRFPKKYSPIK